MFKSHYTNRLYLLFFITIISLMSCDGSDRKYKTSTEVLQENNLLKSFNKKIITVQSEQIQIVTDTILSNGFQVKINYKSVVDNPIIK